MKQKLYFIDYDDICQGCPTFTGGKFLKDGIWTGEHEWDFDDPNPEHYNITSTYSLKIDEKSINFDYSGHNYVSENFLKVLNACKVNYRAVPLEIFLSKNKHPEKKYYFLLLCGRFFLLDKAVSKYTVCKSPNNEKEYLYETYFPNEVCYDLIEEFYVKDDGNLPDFFVCAELKKDVCTEKFKKLCQSLNITRIKFTEISNGFRYDPWED
ncbi:hypothetical protein A4G20_08010 [Pasteurellaceae bacterium RH1A]|nr:hypothetical protein A4G20_08010 [Pasteurellaceae bacterium RH1A]